MGEQLLRIEEVALMIGVSSQTINNWYRWKKINQEHELAQILPDYVQLGNRQLRLWRKEDIWKLIDFKNRIPHGRNGILGEITQRRYRGGNTNEKES